MPSTPRNADTIQVLLIEDNPGDALLFRSMVKSHRSPAFALRHAGSVAAARAELTNGPVDLILLDLGLPDAEGEESFRAVQDLAPEAPIVVLTGRDDDELAVQSVRWGAQDYLVKGAVDSDRLIRSLRYALERHRLQAQVRELALTDELTGLNNRRGFLALGAQELRNALRRKAPAIVLYLDVNAFKAINDTHGHATGDRVLIEVAAALRATFREADLLGRIGGDEFTVLALDIGADDVPMVRDRLLGQPMRVEWAGETVAFSISVGAAVYDPHAPVPLEALIARADEAMYREKPGAIADGSRARARS